MARFKLQPQNEVRRYLANRPYFRCQLRTETGNVSISTTWALTRLRVLSRAAPGELRYPKISRADFKSGKIDGFWAFGNSRPYWRARFDPFREGWRFGADGFLGLPFHPVDWKSREWQRTSARFKLPLGSRRRIMCYSRSHLRIRARLLST